MPAVAGGPPPGGALPLGVEVVQPRAVRDDRSQMLGAA